MHTVIFGVVPVAQYCVELVLSVHATQSVDSVGEHVLQFAIAWARA